MVEGTLLSGIGVASAGYRVDFPSTYVTTYRRTTAPGVPPSWFGSQVDGQRDETGWVYRRHRYYDPLTGRFTQEDPIGLAGGLNLYGYANGDPVNFADPFGLYPECVLGLPCPVVVSGAAVVGGPLTLFGAAVAGIVTLDATFGSVGGYGGLGAAAASDATVVYNKREGKQIKAAIKAATGSEATTSQYNCMSQFIHECKESGDGGSKNKKGDFTWDELVQMAKDLFGKKP